MVKPLAKHPRKYTGQLVLLGIILLALYVLLPQINTFKDIKVTLGHTDFWTASIGVALFGGILVAGAAIYYQLAFKKQSFKSMLFVQLAAAFTGKLLPVGLGSMGLNAQFLVSRKHTVSQAVTAVGVNNLIGIFAHLLLLAGFVALYPSQFTGLFSGGDSGHKTTTTVIGSLLALGAIVALLLIPPIRRRVSSFLRRVRKDVGAYKKRKADMFLALIFSFVLTFLYAGVLHVSQLALGFHISFVQVFIVFSLGMLVGVATPTPGGLGGAEAGLAAGFAAYGMPLTDALAIALLYRFLTYWLPLVPGFIAYMFLRRTL